MSGLQVCQILPEEAKGSANGIFGTYMYVTIQFTVFVCFCIGNVLNGHWGPRTEDWLAPDRPVNKDKFMMATKSLPQPRYIMFVSHPTYKQRTLSIKNARARKYTCLFLKNLT